MTPPKLHNVKSVQDFLDQVAVLVKAYNVTELAIVLASDYGLTTHQFGMDAEGLIMASELFETYAMMLEEETIQ